MKKSELRQLIREEIQALNEASYSNLKWSDFGMPEPPDSKDEDYIEVFDKAFDDTPGLIGVYMPLNHNAANVLAKKAGGLKASWCVGYDGDDGYWYSYS